MLLRLRLPRSSASGGHHLETVQFSYDLKHTAKTIEQLTAMIVCVFLQLKKMNKTTAK